VPKPSLDDARQFLLADGWTLDSQNKLVKDGSPLKVQVLTTTGYPGTGEYMKLQLEKAGFTVQLTDGDNTLWTNELLAGHWDVTIRNNQTGLPFLDAQAIVKTGAVPATGPDGSANVHSMRDPTIISEAAAGRATTGDESCGHWRTFQERVLQQRYFTPLVSVKNIVFSSKDVDLLGGGVECAPTQQAAPCGLSARRVG
jgi:ABC-type transport system substrate-binding protein